MRPSIKLVFLFDEMEEYTGLLSVRRGQVKAGPDSEAFPTTAHEQMTRSVHSSYQGPHMLVASRIAIGLNYERF